MPGFLLTLAEVTLTMSAVILLLLALGPILARRYKIRWRYWAWLAVAVRLLIPVNFSLPNAPVVLTPPDTGPILSAPQPQDRGGTDVSPTVSHFLPSSAPSASPLPSQSISVDGGTASSPPIPQASPGSTAPPPTVSPAPDSAPAPLRLTLGQALFLLWLAVAAVLILWQLAVHWRFRRYLRRWAEPVVDQAALALLEAQKARLGLKASVSLAVCTGVDSPMLAGLFRPVILLPRAPEAGSSDELSLVLLHELCHRRRRDILYKALLFAAAACHWFNPLVWVMVRQGGRDMELCCDDDVSALLTAQEREHYARTILNAIPRTKR